MIHIPGYQLKDTVFKSERSSIFRALRSADKMPVIIKLLNREFPTEEEYSEFLREFEITELVKGSGVIEVYGFEKINNSPAIVMEDISGSSLDTILKVKKLDLKEKLALSIKLIDSLNQVHLHTIVHKDVNPSNFIWNPDTDTVRIIDFGISAELPLENIPAAGPDILEGTLEYIAPEQTGRINRPVDTRSDLYSFGVLLYQLFTGSLPFSFDDAAELIHSHLARIPLHPSEKNPEVPHIVSDIIMKLISKDAEARYQSASGVKWDLLVCQENCRANGRIPEFSLGSRDISTRFTIPSKVYGREDELHALLNAFDNLTSKNPQLFLVHGHSGIGKTSLVNEIRNVVNSKNGFFVSGKVQQFDKHTPYSALIQAFRDLIRQLLKSSRENIEMWKSAFCSSLGNNTQLIIDLIPELEEITGPQQSVPVLTPVEAHNRLLLTFKNFLSVFEENGHPLAVFIDDLQWSDPSTLELLKHLLSAGGEFTVLFIAAYRDNEVKDGDVLVRFLDELKNSSMCEILSTNDINLKPLGLSVIQQIVADTCHCELESAEPLASVIFEKTNGNPFFVNKVLLSLYLEGVFTLNEETGVWEWNIEKVRNTGISDNVVDFLVKQIESLPGDTIEILKLAACIGYQFDLLIISKILHKPFNQIADTIQTAVDKGLIQAVDGSQRLLKYLTKPKAARILFKFNHDRICQAVSTLIPDDVKISMNTQIGNELLLSYLMPGSDVTLFDVVNHMNLGSTGSMEFEKRAKLAALNFCAGDTANNTAAYIEAFAYYEKGKRLLTEDEWKQDREMWISASLTQAQAALFSGNLNNAENICDAVSRIITSSIDKGRLTNVKVMLLEFTGKHIEAVNEIRKCLKLFGIILPVDPGEIQMEIQEGVGIMKSFLKNARIEDIVILPAMKDPEKLMVMQLLFSVVPPALITNPPLYILASLIMFELTMKYGTTDLSCKSLTDCGIIQCTMIGDYDTAYKLGEAAFELIKKHKAESVKAATYFTFTFISHWRKHFNEDFEYYELAYKSGLETGDIQHAAYALAHKVFLQSYTGKSLAENLSEIKNTNKFLTEHKTAVPLLLTSIVQLQIEKYFALPESSEEKNLQEQEKILINSLEQMHNLAFIVRIAHFNSMFHIIHGNIEQANEYCQLAEKLAFAALSDFPIPNQYLFEIIIISKKWDASPADEHEQMSARVSENLKKLQVYKDSAPSNFAHLYHLASAVNAVMHKEALETILAHFNEAMIFYVNDDFIHMKALCNELMGNSGLEEAKQQLERHILKRPIICISNGELLESSVLWKKCTRILSRLINLLSLNHTQGQHIQIM